MNEPQIRETISQDEIDVLRAKHAGICKAVRKAFRQALEIGETLLEWHKRMGVKWGDKGSFWHKWIAEKLPDISRPNIYRYVQLARNRQFLETKFSCLGTREEELENLPTITEALKAIAEKNEENQSKKVARKVINIEAELSNGNTPIGELWSELPIKTVMPSEVTAEPEERAASIAAASFKTPIDTIRQWIEQYVLDLTNSERDLAEIQERIRLTEVPAQEICQLIESACARVPELKTQVIETIIQRSFFTGF